MSSQTTQPPLGSDSVGNWPSLVCTPITPTTTYCKTKIQMFQGPHYSSLRIVPAVLGPSLLTGKVGVAGLNWIQLISKLSIFDSGDATS